MDRKIDVMFGEDKVGWYSDGECHGIRIHVAERLITLTPIKKNGMGASACYISIPYEGNPESLVQSIKDLFK